MNKINIHLTDPPIVLNDLGVLKNTQINITGSTYGRFIFTTPVEVMVTGLHTTIRNNVFNHSGTQDTLLAQ